MKHGQVVHIRVNPEDIMGCIDICKAAKVYIVGMSMGQIVRLSLSGLLEAARKQEAIPRRDGFEYLEMIRPILGEVGEDERAHRVVRKLQVSSVIEDLEIERIIQGKPATPVEIAFRKPGLRDDAPELTDNLVRERGKIGWRINELVIKERDNPLNWSAEDAHELAGLRARYDETERQINNGRQA